MATNRYADRPLWSVALDFAPGVMNPHQANAARGIGVTVVVALESRDGGGLGPNASLNFGLDPEDGETVAALEARAIDAARQLLGRLAAASGEELLATRQREVERQLKPFFAPPEAEG